MATLDNSETFAPVKDPDSVVDYGFDWSEWLTEGDSVAVSVWILPDGLTGSDYVNTGTTTGVKLTGGELYVDYPVTNRISTAAGRTEDRTMIIPCREK